MSSTGSGDLTFKSTSEIKSYIRYQMDLPGYTAGSANLAEQYGGNSMFRKNSADGFVGLDGQNIEAQTSAF